MSPTPTIFWFRRDLRLSDNRALTQAAQVGHGRVAATFVIDDTFCAPAGPTRVEFLRRTLSALSQSLEGRLHVLAGDPAKVLGELARSVGATIVFATADFAPAGRRRDQLVAEALRAQGIELQLVDSPYVVTPGTVVTKTGTPCRVFTAFRRGWEEIATSTTLGSVEADWLTSPSTDLGELTSRSAQRRPDYFGDLPDSVAPAMIEAGEAAAHQQLENFRGAVDRYAEARNIPGVEGTSRLSAHLRFGTLHPRQVLAALDGVSPDRATFRSEICWREFYADVLWHHPDSIWRVLQPSMEHLRIDRDDAAIERFQTWARGETGYPLVDAGMRQLLSEGWMHNRVRMVAASFLVKHLHLDWRWGAKWFMWRLIDGDVASNQHGWQWTAGTGTDAAPFHRIFNPTLQAERFDAQGEYVRRWIPELVDVAAPQCLQPGGGTGLLAPSNYAAPIVDAARERDEALARFAEARALAKVSP